ncbi:MAG TPA: hypothetical protein VFZ73_08985 [Gemmatimonadaceae bacterium]
MSRYLQTLGPFLFGTLGCLPGNSVHWSWEPVPEEWTCVVPVDGRVEVTETSRRACVAMADILEPELPHLTIDALRAGPPSALAFRSDEHVSCRLTPRIDDGGSLKFRCLRTDSLNRFYDEDGRLVAEPAVADDDGVLHDVEGQPIVDGEGKPRKGDELRVKYFRGDFPEARYREMFTETVVSHLFWALGIPVDRVYMPASVRCFGCGPNPDQQAQLDSAPVPRVFRFASIERRYEGKKINVARKRGWMGLGGGYDHGFAFGELEGLAASGSSQRRIDTEVLVTALNVVAYNSPSSYQNELICRPGKWDRETGICTSSVAYVQDVGGTLGGEKARALPGVPKSEMQDHPRGDWPTFSQDRVFDDPRDCTLTYEFAGIERLSEAGRQAFARRVQNRLGLQELLVIFEKANIHKMDRRVTTLAAEQSGLPRGEALDRYIQGMWAEAVDERLNEVLNARCPA